MASVMTPTRPEPDTKCEAGAAPVPSCDAADDAPLAAALDAPEDMAAPALEVPAVMVAMAPDDEPVALELAAAPLAMTV